MKLGDAERIVVTTFDAVGTPTSSDEWVVALDADRVGFWTPHANPWVERLALTDVVSVQAADHRGRPVREEPVLEGRMELVQEGEDFDRLRILTREKYTSAVTVATAVDWAWEIDGARSPEAGLVIHVVG